MGRKTCLMITILIVIILPSMFAPDHITPTRRSFQLHKSPKLSQDLTNATSIEIGTNAGFSSLGFNGSGTADNPYVISGLRIYDTYRGIYIRDTDVHFVIRNCNLIGLGTGQRQGIYLFSVSNARIENCIIEDQYDGLYAYNTQNSSIINVTSVDAINGILLLNVSRIVVANSDVHGNTQGIVLQDAFDCVVRNCKAYSNREEGVFLTSSSHNCTIYDNSIGWNADQLITNDRGNALDEGYNNSWYNLVFRRGNLWSDYNGTELFYEVGGNSSYLDRYPRILNDYESPRINSPLDIRYEEGERGSYLEWTPEDNFPYRYEIFMDNDAFEAGYWNGGNISIEVDQLWIGGFNFTLQVEDGSGKTASDTVYVIVVLSMFGGLGTEQVVASSAISVICVIFVIVVVKRLR